MKKYIILIAILVIIGAVVFFVINNRANNSSGGAISSGESQPSGSMATTTQSLHVSDIMKNISQDPRIIIGTTHGSVSVKNFYISNPEVGEAGTVIIEETQNYFIAYDTLSSDFWVAITGTPLATWRQAAEQDFLNILQINKSDACKLNVLQGILNDPNSQLQGIASSLSFCNQVFGTQP